TFRYAAHSFNQHTSKLHKRMKPSLFLTQKAGNCTLRYLLLPLLWLTFTATQAQNATISGKVLEDADKPMGYANVLLLKAADSSLVKGTLTDEGGAYRFEGIAIGKYRLVASMLGYGKS